MSCVPIRCVCAKYVMPSKMVYNYVQLFLTFFVYALRYVHIMSEIKPKMWMFPRPNLTQIISRYIINQNKTCVFLTRGIPGELDWQLAPLSLWRSSQQTNDGWQCSEAVLFTHWGGRRTQQLYHGQLVNIWWACPFVSCLLFALSTFSSSTMKGKANPMLLLYDTEAMSFDNWLPGRALYVSFIPLTACCRATWNTYNTGTLRGRKYCPAEGKAERCLLCLWSRCHCTKVTGRSE